MLMVVYSNNPNHPIFGHQNVIVNTMNKLEDGLCVIELIGKRTKLGTLIKARRLRHFCVGWEEGKTLTNIFFLIVFTLIIIVYHRPRLAFFHMAETAAAILGPLFRVNKTRVILWYAHQALTIRLRIATFFSNAVLTSTLGSFPVPSAKLHHLGQSIDESVFVPAKRNSYLARGIYLGRLDHSKRIPYIVEEMAKLRKVGFSFEIHFYGYFSSLAEERFGLENIEIYKSKFNWLSSSFKGAMPRTRLPEAISRYDFLVHAFNGSLDKVLVEATLGKLIVLTENQEYLREFGIWPGCDPYSSLSHQFEALKRLPFDSIDKILDARYERALSHHSLSAWTKGFLRIRESLEA